MRIWEAKSSSMVRYVKRTCIKAKTMNSTVTRILKYYVSQRICSGCTLHFMDWIHPLFICLFLLWSATMAVVGGMILLLLSSLSSFRLQTADYDSDRHVDSLGLLSLMLLLLLHYSQRSFCNGNEVCVDGKTITIKWQAKQKVATSASTLHFFSFASATNHYTFPSFPFH